MTKTIHAVVLDGFHRGHVIRLPYSPTIRLVKPSIVMVDTCCPGYPDTEPTRPEHVEYVECFHAVDREVVFYSEKGESMDVLTSGFFPIEATTKPWTPRTTLYFGYHDGLLRREESNAPTVDHKVE